MADTSAPVDIQTPDVLARFGLSLPGNCNDKSNMLDMEHMRIGIVLKHTDPCASLFDESMESSADNKKEIKLIAVVCEEWSASCSEFICVDGIDESLRKQNLAAGGGSNDISVLVPRIAYKNKSYVDLFLPGNAKDDRRIWVDSELKTHTNLIDQHAPELKGVDVHQGINILVGSDNFHYYHVSYECVNKAIYCPLGYWYHLWHTKMYPNLNKSPVHVLCPDGIKRMGYIISINEGLRHLAYMKRWINDPRTLVNVESFRFRGVCNDAEWKLCATLNVYYSTRT